MATTTINATRWLREAVAEALSLALVLQRAVTTGGFDPYALRRALEAAILKIKLDDEARALGFTAELLRRVRLALIATADEIAQRPGSRADYSAPPPPGELPLLQQKYFNNTTSAGHHFFEELAATIDARRPGDAESAVIEVFAVCLALGFRGKYEAHDIAGHEAMRNRVTDKLRRALAVPELPPVSPPARWPLPPRGSGLLAAVAAVAALFAAALLLTYQAELSADAEALRGHLEDLLTALPS